MNSSPARFTDGENQSILAGGEWALQVFSEARLDSVHTDARAGPPAETSLRDLPFDHSPTNNDTCAVDAASSINYNSLSDVTATNANAMSEQRVTRTAHQLQREQTITVRTSWWARRRYPHLLIGQRSMSCSRTSTSFVLGVGGLVEWNPQPCPLPWADTAARLGGLPVYPGSSHS